MSRLQGPNSLRVANFKRRLKLSHDPNNTTWSRSATKYGQKILQSHGWTPGKLLGASGAAYSDLRSAASGSHIRIALKDDKLGLGAKHDAAYTNCETIGLDVFQDLLGHLNGRSVANITKNRIQSSTLRSSAYIIQRWGNLPFISGGLLVGDKPRDLVNGEQDALNDSRQTPSHREEMGTLPKLGRPQEVRSDISKRKRHKRRKASGDDYRVKETSKETDWRSTGSQSREDPCVEPKAESHTLSEAMSSHFHGDQVQRHGEGAERKLKRQGKNGGRPSSKVREQTSTLPSPDPIQLSSVEDIGKVAVKSHQPRETNASARSSQYVGADRLSVRHRYIQHKKMCMMDHKALNEVCVIWHLSAHSGWLTIHRS